MNAETRQCQNCKKEFVIEPEDFKFYEKISVPPPTWCPECRFKRRLLDRNEWSLYSRKCDFTGENIISIYRPDAPFPVYKQDIWRSDKWNPLDYGQGFDFNRPFFEQYEELRRKVPHLSLVNSNSVNSEYSNQSQDNKDCYMVSATGGSEKCMYGNWFQPGSYFSADCYMIDKSELCYECINCGRSHSCVWCQDCFDCVSCSFSVDLRGCSNCFGCVGLRHKQYCWFNEQLSKEDYQQRLGEFDWSRGSIDLVRKKMSKFILGFPRKFYHGYKINNSTGDYLENAEWVRLCFNGRENKESAYLQDAWKMIDCFDATEILQAERCYEIQGCAYLKNCIGIRSSWTMSYCYYCDMCFSCEDCFGCFGLRQEQYCILNKRYPKDDYLKLKDKIIAHMQKTGEWGEYFPSDVSPFAYNESVAQDFFPMTREEAKTQNISWYNREDRGYKFTMQASDVPGRIAETNDSILNKIIQCQTQNFEDEKRSHPLCTTAFTIIPLELALYRKLGIQVPAKCFPCRRTDRFLLRNPRKLWHRQCMCDYQIYKNFSKHEHHPESRCQNKFETAYSPENPAIVYCEQCYIREVV